MNRFGKIAVCFASGLVLNAGLCVSNGVLSRDPYEPIVTRNIFDLNPPQANVPPPPAEPPCKITPNGITTIFGTPQALYTVDVPARPPTPATEKSYILGEGQRQDGIEVVHIDVKSGVVTFNNEGVVQEIPLVKAPPITTPTPVVMNTSFNPAAAAPNSYGYNGGGNPGRFGGRFGQNGSTGSSGGNFGNNNGNFGNPSFGSVNSGSTGGPAQQQQQLSPEEQTILIAAQKAQAKQTGDPIWKIYPPTELDSAAGTDNTSPPPTPPTP